MSQTYETVLTFWFDELEPRQWWRKDEAVDREISERFSEVHAAAAQCELFEWRRDARGRLAEVIVLDQFSRHMFRDSARAYSCDPLALALAQEAVANRADETLTPVEKGFLYMPFMHSESLKIHEVAERLFRDAGLEENLRHELRHKAIIERFGRYPHRNAVLGRATTAAEREFLEKRGFGF